MKHKNAKKHTTASSHRKVYTNNAYLHISLIYTISNQPADKPIEHLINSCILLVRITEKKTEASDAFLISNSKRVEWGGGGGETRKKMRYEHKQSESR